MAERELFLGRQANADDLSPAGDWATLDPDRLTRHGVVLGMTGSGKTGLCITLMEELAMAGVPILAIDPKGDIANLALVFPQMRSSDFAPWIDPAEADRSGRSVDEEAEVVAKRWRDGLTQWQAYPDRAKALAEAASVTVYTPGSESGVSIDLLGSLGQVPDVDGEARRELVSGTVSGLLGLVGVRAEPMRDPSHVVLSHLLETAWAEGTTMDVEQLIVKLVDPPFQKVGVFPVDQFFPRKERLDLAMQLNAVLASPAFAAWQAGVPLDLDAFLSPGADGKVPIRVFYTAHLDDAGRTFFTAMLLNRLVAWMRRQPGTGSLRALLYIDEVYGLMPPHPANPPTKRPLLTLLKQARAMGLGVVLATQNPIDLDYSALSNTGMWWLGKLSTRQDQDRVLDGLASAQGDVDKATLRGWLEKLPKRTFVVRDVRESAPQLWTCRWAISYLRGPLTRREVARLKPDLPDLPPPPPGGARPAAPEAVPDGFTPHPPPPPGKAAYRFLVPEIAHSARLAPFLGDAAEPRRSDGRTVWRPALYAAMHLRFDERGFEFERPEHRLFFPIEGEEPYFRGEPELIDDDLTSSVPDGDHLFAPLPALCDEAAELKALKNKVVEEVYRGETSVRFKHATTKLSSRGGEDGEAFRTRVEGALRDRIDAKIVKLKSKVDGKVSTLEGRLVRKQRDLEQHASAVSAKMANEAVNVGETLLSMFFGRRKTLTTAMSKRTQTRAAQDRVGRTEEEIAELERQMYDLQSELEAEMLEIENAELRTLDDITEQSIGLERSDIRVDDFVVLWIPVSRQL
ncbi:MAG: hypothetical protein ACI8PZ_002962 [Myxococcota bacterium]|jgi:hypothetical protein